MNGLRYFNTKYFQSTANFHTILSQSKNIVILETSKQNYVNLEEILKIIRPQRTKMTMNLI